MAVTNVCDVVNHSQLMNILFSGKDDNQGNDVSIVPDLIKLHQESSTSYPYAWIDNSVAVPSEAIIKKVEFTGSKEEINLPFDLNGSMVDHWRIGGITKLIMASEKYGTSDRLSFLIDNGVFYQHIPGKVEINVIKRLVFFLNVGHYFLLVGMFMTLLVRQLMIQLLSLLLQIFMFLLWDIWPRQLTRWKNLI